MRAFPSGFFWGAATAAYQVEGDNRNCDWWEWEQRASVPDRCGDSCRQYEMFAQDFALAKSLNHNAHRLSIEWSRLEPREGEFDEREIAHYRKVLQSLRDHGLEPVVTLHHFTNPLWFSKKGGWISVDAPDCFLRFVRRIVPEFSDLVTYWVTVNEPMVYAYQAFLIGAWPPQERSLFLAMRSARMMLRAHIGAYRAIKRIYGATHSMVGFAHNMRAFVPCDQSLRTKAAAWARDLLFNRWFLEWVVAERTVDYLGVNYYSRDVVQADAWKPSVLLQQTCSSPKDPMPKNSLGWDIYPQGLKDILMSLKRYRLPVFILENGICTDDDAQRWEFIRAHLAALRDAMDAGVPVIGYLYWSLIDNYEWDKGFRPRFGLVEVDYRTCERRVRESARKFAQVCSQGSV